MVKEKRSARRLPSRYTAWVALTAEQRHGCVISNVSDSGARIDVQDSKILPDCFVLMLANNAAARRYCRVIWRKPTRVGVKFERNMAEAGEATLAPKSDADQKAAPARAAEPAKTA
jgi:PilZ domain